MIVAEGVDHDSRGMFKNLKMTGARLLSDNHRNIKPHCLDGGRVGGQIDNLIEMHLQCRRTSHRPDRLRPRPRPRPRPHPHPHPHPLQRRLLEV
jgi:hypothetical protein